MSKHKPYALHREYFRRKHAGVRKRVQRRIREFINRSKMQPCKDCGKQYNPWVMDFDHRDQSAKRANISSLSTISSVKAEMLKCDIVCANCHRERTYMGKHWIPVGKVIGEDKQLSLFSTAQK